MPTTPFPLNIINKEDSPARLEKLAGVDPKFYLTAEETNEIVAALNYLNETDNISQYQSYLNTTTDNPPLSEQEWSDSLQSPETDPIFTGWLNTNPLANFVTLTSIYDASTTERGFINTIAQDFAGTKSFNNLIWAKATPTNTVDTNLGSIGIGTDGSNPLFSFRIDTVGNLNLDRVYNSIFSNVLSVNRQMGKLEVNNDVLINGLTVGKGGGNITSNTANGVQALYSNTTGNGNTANGYNTLYSNTTGSANTANGVQALYSNTTGGYNTANGVSSLFSNTTGNYNTANGVGSLRNNTTGGENVANGYYSLFSNTTGNGNTANGVQALYSNTTGNFNTANGIISLYYNTTGYQNTANGVNSGSYVGTGTTPNSTGNNSVFIGYDTRAAANGQTNQIVVGASAIGNGSNTATMGNSSVTALYVGGNGAGIVLKTPDGSKSYRISIDNNGAVISTLI